MKCVIFKLQNWELNLRQLSRWREWCLCKNQKHCQLLLIKQLLAGGLDAFSSLQQEITKAFCLTSQYSKHKSRTGACVMSFRFSDSHKDQ